jgi:hypothetical protein
MIWSMTVFALSIRSCRSCLELAPNAGPASKKQRQIDEIAFFMWGFLSSSRSIARVVGRFQLGNAGFGFVGFGPARLACWHWSPLEVRVNLKLAIPATKTGKRKGDYKRRDGAPLAMSRPEMNPTLQPSTAASNKPHLPD